MSTANIITTRFPHVTHVIFDLDGTLIDSEKFVHLALNDVLAGEYGQAGGIDQALRSKTIGLDLRNSAPVIIEHLGLPCTAPTFIGQVLARFKRHITGEFDVGGVGVRLLPGAKRLVAHLAAHHVPMAICTGSMRESYEHKVKLFDDYFTPGVIFRHVVVGVDDPEVSRNKPHPDPYLVAIKRFGSEDQPPPPPSKVLAFEDSPTGLTSAVTAGAQTVFVQANPNVDLAACQVTPTLRLTSLEDFKPEDFGLPPYASEEDSKE